MPAQNSSGRGLEEIERSTHLLLDFVWSAYSCMVSVQIMTKGTATSRISSQCNHCVASYIRIRKCPERHDPVGTTGLALWAQLGSNKCKVNTPRVRGIVSKAPSSAYRQCRQSKGCLWVLITSTFFMQAALCFPSIVRPGLAERSEWLGVKQALGFYCRLALQHLCFEFHLCRALQKLEGT